MPTVKELRVQAKSYGLRGYSHLRQGDLVQLITEARAPILRERVARALKTGRYPALRRDIDNPHKKAQRIRELHQLQDEVTAALRAQKYEQEIKSNPRKRLEILRKVQKRAIRHGFRKEPLARVIAQEGERILEEIQPKESEEKGRRTVTWKLFQNLNGSTDERFMTKIAELQTAFYLRYSFTYRLRNIENGKIMLWSKNLGGSATMLTNQAAARQWLQEKDENRLDINKIERPNTKWSFVTWVQVEVKAILTNHPILGAGQLPDWLRNKKGMYALDTYDDNLCLFRCIAVHKGAYPNRCTKTAQQLAEEYYGIAPACCPKFELSQLKKAEEKFKLGIRVYEPSEGGTWRLTRLPAHYEAIGIQPMTLGFFNDHAFLIKDITKVAHQYACAHCNQQFTQVCHLQRHADRCTKGETQVCCPGELVERQQSAYEKAFYPKSNASKGSIDWLEYEAEKRNLHIHHARCGHGGERWIVGAPVDGYEPTTKTVFQYHGCHFHGCPAHCKQGNAHELLRKTQQQELKIRNAGYNLVIVWECNAPGYKQLAFEPKTVIYPHAIVYDFEAYLDKTKCYRPTADLTYENVHVPISVSVGDTMDSQPTHLCEREPKVLIEKFMNELQRRAAKLRADVEQQFLPSDIELLPKRQQQKIHDWCAQVPVLGFNSGKYDLNLIKEYFTAKLADTCTKVKVATQGSKTMFIITPEFKFLDVINYLGPGTSYDKWVKAYGCKQTKSWFPYEWFDSPDKLDYPGLPDYTAWYSRQKAAYLLTLQEWRTCKRVFDERGMTSFADWLQYYNNLDVSPFIEALEKMKAFYGERGIDLCNDAVSLPGVALQYLLRGTAENKLYAPSKQAYNHLKAAVSGGPSIVFTRYHEAGVTRIRSHQYTAAKPCKRILGYDANALYLSTMLKDMPCGNEKVTDYEDPENAASWVKNAILKGKLFGFVKCKLATPKALWAKFEEMPPIFVNREVPEAAVSQEMMDYLTRTGRKRTSTKKLLGVLEADEILLYTPLLRWYIEHGLELQAVYTTIEYQPEKILAWFVDAVTKARRTGDIDNEKAILAEFFKLLGNSSYGKLIEALERHTNVSYTKDETTVGHALRSAWFDDLTEIGDAYEITSRKPRVTIHRPFQVGIAVYQLAKLRILEFNHDFLDCFVDRKDFELIQMDTDSLYFALSANTLEEVVKPELQIEFKNCKNDWLAWDTWSNRTPGLFKLEFEGHRAIALCSKCYFVDSEKKSKHSSKGMSARHNSLTWGRYKVALEGTIDRAENRGFRLRNGQMTTYSQEKLGLSAYYDKRRVLPDGIHTVPIEYVKEPDQGVVQCRAEQ